MIDRDNHDKGFSRTESITADKAADFLDRLSFRIKLILMIYWLVQAHLRLGGDDAIHFSPLAFFSVISHENFLYTARKFPLYRKKISVIPRVNFRYTAGFHADVPGIRSSAFALVEKKFLPLLPTA